jgi:glycosyltransferase involved in cell wall biosynthesis
MADEHVEHVRGDLNDLVAASSIRRVRMIAWRDLDDPEAGGSELHAHRVAARWASAGLDVSMRTSRVAGATAEVMREGYRSIRKGGRYAVFPEVISEGVRAGAPEGSALVEIWNGMPFFSPIWFKGPRIVFLHHVHAEMWDMVLSKGLARLGNALESRVAPPRYRSTTIVTLSESSRDEIIELLRMDPAMVHVVPPGIEPRFSPGPGRASNPHVVAVGRLVPVKQFDRLIRDLVVVKAQVPELTASILGEGYDRGALEELRSSLGADEWLAMPGRVSDEEQVDEYRRAWLVASSSAREGWGMTLTEAAACGTPSVASDIAGHRDAVQGGRSGLLVDPDSSLAETITAVLTDASRRRQLEDGALSYAKTLTWERTATRAFGFLDAAARQR